MTIATTSQIFNPVSGVFGTGQMQIFGAGMSGIWTVPPGIGKVRVRCFGGGGTSGGGGGFAIKAVYDLAGITLIPVTVASAGGTSSFGSYVSATGGSTTSPYTGGSGVGGDVNSSGGTGRGSGVGSLFGNGGSATGPNPGASGYYDSSWSGAGLMGSGAIAGTVTGYASTGNSGMQSSFSIDFIGTGGGGVTNSGYNGGGGYTGGYPGGGGNANGGAPGMVIVEW